MNLGTKIRNIRYSNHLSQDEMAKMLKINRNNLSRIENNKSFPTPDVLTRIAEAFSISLDTLLGVNLDGKDGEKVRTDKIKKINSYCSYLSIQELDFIVNMLCVMSNNYKNDDSND